MIDSQRWILGLCACVGIVIAACSPSEREGRPEEPGNTQPQVRQLPAGTKEALLESFPKTIKGADRREPSFGRIGNAKGEILTASCDYIFSDNGGSLVIAITAYPDPGQYWSSYEIEYDESAVLRSDKRSWVQTPYGRAVQYFDPDARSGNFELFIGNRFGVRLEGRSIPEDVTDIAAYLELVDVNVLKQTLE